MKSMFQQQKPKKKPPPRPPPPNFIKFRSKSSFNLTHENPNLIEWSPPSTPKSEVRHHNQFGGSVSSSYSSSTSSLTSSKKSLENDQSLLNLSFNLTPNWTSSNLDNSNNVPKPRIIRALPPKKNDKEESLPMPKIPPPKPPQVSNVVTPYGVALFDFPATQPGDLPLQVNDIVILIRRVNNEWLYGRVCDTEGIFPDNFIRVEVPLPGETQIVTALYEFNPQMAGDLALKLGQKVKVVKEISDEWLYGESEGKTGQFPRNFVA